MSTYTEAVDTLSKDWFRRCRESQRAHYEYGSVLERRHVCFGVPAILLSTVVGTAVFSSAQESKSLGEHTSLIFGLLSMLAAALTALQTFLNLADRAAKHRSAGAAYGAIRRDLEFLKTLPPSSEESMRQRIEEIKRKMDDLAESAPGIPSRFKRKIDEELKSRAHERIFRLGGEGK